MPELLELLSHDTTVIRLTIDEEALPGYIVVVLDKPKAAPVPPPPSTLPDLPHRTPGFDAARYQPRIDFKKTIAEGGQRFAILKCGEGANYTDPTFFTKWRDGEAAGIHLGAYHFFRPDAKNPSAQAAYIQRILGDKWGAMGLWIDVERPITNGQPVDPATYAQTIERDLRILLDELELIRPEGANLGIYTAPNYWETLLPGATDLLNDKRRKVWIANYPFNYTDAYRPRLPRGMLAEQLAIWQFDNGEATWSQKIPGVTDVFGRLAKVDRNFFWKP